jgi:cytidine deaminase
LRVGAALEGRSGKVYIGCNVENSSFGLTICAERAALFRAIAEGEREFRRLVIYTPDGGPLSPCGACRQVLAEFSPRLRILSVGRGGLRREFNLADLLPEAFAWPAGEAD